MRLKEVLVPCTVHDLEAHGLSLYSDIGARLAEIEKKDIEKLAERPQTLRRINSASSYGESFQGYIKKENKTAKKSLKKYHNISCTYIE
jgi:hypothetical protein